MSPPRIVVVGGGAGGIGVATRLGRHLGRKGKADVVLVDMAEAHVWKPLLHEAATGSLDTGIEAMSYRGHARINGYRFQQGTLVDIDRGRRHVELAPILDGDQELLPARQIGYDYLVIAVGSVADDFGIPGVQQNCRFLDTTSQALDIQRSLRKHFLRYARDERLEEKIKVVIIGAGSTGAEMAAEMANAVHQLKGYGFNVHAGMLSITLVEAKSDILPDVHRPAIRESVAGQLREMGITIRTGQGVVQAEPGRIILADGSVLEADLALWAAGIKAPDVLADIGGLETTSSNQVLVRPNAQTTQDDRIFAIGDCCACPQPDGSLAPPRGQVARQMGHMVVRNLIDILEGREPRREYVYRDLGSLVNLSRFHTVGNLFSFLGGGIMVEGRLARFTYHSLYRRHLLEVYGLIRGSLMMAVRSLSHFLRPSLKLH
ncbi:MAG: NAD(P)/FAD-dependent oxidoreductase [Wenzhouxiangella sp.]|nr:MAG: NAD(P)/FAD-dependent oxidoreductase [Wenzhouxiangella sp.]